MYINWNVFKTVIAFMLFCVHDQVLLYEKHGQISKTSSKKPRIDAHTVITDEDRGLKQSSIILNRFHEKAVFQDDLGTTTSYPRRPLDVQLTQWNIEEQHMTFKRFSRKKRSDNVSFVSKPLQPALNSEQSSSSHNLNININDTKLLREKDIHDETNDQKRFTNETTHINGRPNLITNGSSDSLVNASALSIYARRLRHSRDARSATLCLSAVLILLLAVVLHSRMWQKRDQWRTLEEVLNEQEAKSELPQHGKISIKDLIETKISLIKSQFKRIQNNQYHLSQKKRMRGSYRELVQSEVSGEETIFSSR